MSLIPESNNDLNVSSISPSEAGSKFSGLNVENEKIWMNYSSIGANSNHRRKIVAIIEGKVPEGIKVYVEASDYSGSGNGKLGISSGLTALSDQPSEVISDIGSCYTGKGINNGHFLQYKLEFDKTDDNYSALTQAESSFNVIYTLTDTY